MTSTSLRVWAFYAAFAAAGCSERLSVAEAERLLDKADIFDPVLCSTPLRISSGQPRFWGAENVSHSLEAWDCIDVLHELELVKTGYVWRGDPTALPSCLEGGAIVVYEAVPQKSEILNGTLMLNCGKSRVQVIDIAHEEHVARIFFRELREPDPNTMIRLRACSLSEPDETWHDHVLDAYFARGKWHLGRD